jgi:polyprenyl P-hydroxybenzoate/phenylacrylic acid decarboxylase-like protein
MGLVRLCRVKLLAAIRAGYGVGFTVGATDVILKERHGSVLATQERPQSWIHLDNMLVPMGIGATAVTPMSVFYHRCNALEEIVGQVVARVLYRFGLEPPDIRSWRGRVQPCSLDASVNCAGAISTSREDS